MIESGDMEQRERRKLKNPIAPIHGADGTLPRSTIIVRLYPQKCLHQHVSVVYYRYEVMEVIYRPQYMSKIMSYVDTPFVKVLAGVRRCGKSTILKMIAEELRKRGVPDERILLYNFDSTGL